MKHALKKEGEVVRVRKIVNAQVEHLRDVLGEVATFKSLDLLQLVENVCDTRVVADYGYEVIVFRDAAVFWVAGKCLPKVR